MIDITVTKTMAVNKELNRLWLKEKKKKKGKIFSITSTISGCHYEARDGGNPTRVQKGTNQVKKKKYNRKKQSQATECAALFCLCKNYTLTFALDKHGEDAELNIVIADTLMNQSTETHGNEWQFPNESFHSLLEGYLKKWIAG